MTDPSPTDAETTGSPPTPRTAVHRHPERGRYDRATIDAILDEGLVCHLGFVADGSPVVVPTMYVRDGDRVVVHGSSATRMTRTLSAGVPVCLTVTLLDGVVFARTANNHSMNYRSAVLQGTASPITEPGEKLLAMRALIEHIAAGRWDRIREPNPKEMRATTVLELPIEEASAKVRTGPPLDDGEDLAVAVWAGVVPLATVVGEPLPDPALPTTVRPGLDIDGFVRRFSPDRPG
jgi:nitroimidazol reductase NimA-like FMN-containing flavoprotein (pyridoxamine 5'-phosphate oxidase superfamily)